MNNSRDEFLCKYPLKSLQLARDTLLACMQLSADDMRNMLIAINDEILNRMTDPTPGENEEE